MSTGKDTKKPSLNPQAAKILEQYRNAGKGIPAGGDATAEHGEGGNGAPVKPAGPPPASQMRRSGTRGK